MPARLVGLVAGAGWLGVLAAAAYRGHLVFTSPRRGLDLRPLYDAGIAVAHGRSPYDIAAFVYLPPAACLWAVTAPLSLWTVRLLYLVVLLACVVVMASGTAVLCTAARWRVVAAAALSIVVLFSGTASWSLC